jgi:hypothetical protein
MDSGIHELTFTEASRAAVDELVAHMNGIYDSTPPRGIARVLVQHHNVGMQPVTYMFQRMREWHARRPVHFSSRAAILIDDTILAWLVDSLLRTVLRTAAVELRYFDARDREAAIRWLLAE